MKSRASLMAMLAIAAGTLLGAASGCELIANVDRSKIEGGAGGTTATAGGGTGGTTTTPTGGTGGTGGTTGCTDDAGCPAPADECKVAVCDTATGMCGEGNAPDGTDAMTQTTGDCMKNVCMGGAVTAVPESTDVLDDGNDCTDDICDADNKPATTPTMAGAMCSGASGAKMCDGAANCVECLMDADCTDPALPKCSPGNQCVKLQCLNGVMDGDETATDCGGATCDPCTDGLACNVPGDCQSGVCTGNICQVPTCDDGVKNGNETDMDCGMACGDPNKLCGASKGCDADGDCTGNQCTGMGGTCVPNCADKEKNNAETDADCGGGTCGKCGVGKDCGNSDNNCVDTAYCDAGTCAAKKDPGTGCVGANECTSGFCTDMVCCNAACAGTCVACVGAKTGQANGTCSNVTANTDPDTECAGTDICDGNGACAKAKGTACGGNAECATGFCVDGVCCDTTCTGACKACTAAKTGGANGTCGNITNATDPDNECAGSISCNGSGACGNLLADGAACTLDTECTNNHCVDGVCCNSTCTGTCQACSAAKKGQGTNGTCGPIVLGQDPDNECAGTDVCNGSNTCAKPLGGACAVGGDCASGFCADGVCCNTACGGTCQACSAAKTGGANGTCGDVTAGTDPDNECSGALTCTAGACAAPFANGTACTIGAECASTFCVDNFCCGSICNGQCQACSAAKNGGTNGTCGAIPVLTDPDNECALTCNGGSGCISASYTACSPAGSANKCDGGAGNMPVPCPASGICLGAPGAMCTANAVGVCVNGDCDSMGVCP